MKEKCSFAGCDNPASICFECHGKECIGRFDLWKQKYVEKLKVEYKKWFEEVYGDLVFSGSDWLKTMEDLG